MSSYKILVNGEEQASVQSKMGDRVVLTFAREDGNTTSHTLEPEVMSDYPYVTLDVERPDGSGAEEQGGTPPEATADEGEESAADSQAASGAEERA